ncbi:MAG: hypothetical protein WBI17_02315 [Clostridiaceae bacterium]
MKKKITNVIYVLVGLSLVFIFFQPDKKESIFSGMLVIVTSVSVLISYMMYTSQTTPKLYVIGRLENTDRRTDYLLMRDFVSSQDEDIEGLASEDNYKCIKLNIHNNGNIPATNIKIEYNIVTYINDIKFGVDKAEILDYKSVKFERVTRNLEYDYIPPGDSRSEIIFYVSRYPQCDIVVNKLVCSEEKFISSDTVVFRYNDERFEELGDNQDLLFLLGVYNPHITH